MSNITMTLTEEQVQVIEEALADFIDTCKQTRTQYAIPQLTEILTGEIRIANSILNNIQKLVTVEVK